MLCGRNFFHCVFAFIQMNFIYYNIKVLFCCCIKTYYKTCTFIFNSRTKRIVGICFLGTWDNFIAEFSTKTLINVLILVGFSQRRITFNIYIFRENVLHTWDSGLVVWDTWRPIYYVMILWCCVWWSRPSQWR